MKVRDLLAPRGGRVLRGELVDIVATEPASTSSPQTATVDMANGKEATQTAPAERAEPVDQAPEGNADGPGWFAALLDSARSDFAVSATWTGRAPSLDDAWHDDPTADIPPEYGVLRRLRLGYHYTVALAGVAIGAGIAWSLYRPFRGLAVIGASIFAITKLF
jgi:hypothetical protein